MTRLYVLWAFVKWCFMKMFGGTFDKLESFRYNLKQGAPDSIFAVLAFIIISAVTMIALMLITAAFTDSTQVIWNVGASVFWLLVVTFFYNIFKAAYECFEDERQDLIERLKT